MGIYSKQQPRHENGIKLSGDEDDDARRRLTMNKTLGVYYYYYGPQRKMPSIPSQNRPQTIRKGNGQKIENPKQKITWPTAQTQNWRNLQSS